MRRDEVGVNHEPEDPETVAEVVFPDGSVPLSRISRTAFECFGAPDVIDEHVDVAVIVADLFGQAFHLLASRWSTATAIPVPPSS